MSLAHLKARRRAAAGVLLVANLLPALYTGLVHQRGALDVMTRLQELCEPPGPAGSPSPEVLFLMPCHSTPYYRYCQTSPCHSTPCYSSPCHSTPYYRYCHTSPCHSTSYYR